MEKNNDCGGDDGGDGGKATDVDLTATSNVKPVGEEQNNSSNGVTERADFESRFSQASSDLLLACQKIEQKLASLRLAAQNRRRRYGISEAITNLNQETSDGHDDKKYSGNDEDNQSSGNIREDGDDYYEEDLFNLHHHHDSGNAGVEDHESIGSTGENCDDNNEDDATDLHSHHDSGNAGVEDHESIGSTGENCDDNNEEDVSDVHSRHDLGNDDGEGNESSGSTRENSDDNYEDDASYVTFIDGEIDPSDYPDDEAYARALQGAEEYAMFARFEFMPWTNEDMRPEEDGDDHSDRQQVQGNWADVDPDELSYEELLALGDYIGRESKGLSPTQISSLPSITYNSENNQATLDGMCVICQLEYEDEDTLTLLPCKHSYHSECINNWLQLNKVCPICNAEVSTSTNS